MGGRNAPYFSNTRVFPSDTKDMASERHGRGRERQTGSGTLTVAAEGFRRKLQGFAADVSEGGLGMTLTCALQVGSQIHVSGEVTTSGGPQPLKAMAQVRWCALDGAGRYRIGLQLLDEAAAAAPPETSDPYEILQLSTQADQDTISRVHRILAARYHPDNKETGDPALFRAVLDAYRTLGDPEKRAAYDAGDLVRRQLRWKLFDSAADTLGPEGERRKRQGILQMLYAQRLQQPAQAAVGLRDMERLLDCPKEHLEFALWYLKENGLIASGDNGRYVITAKGVDHVEQSHLHFTSPTPLLRAAAQ